MIKLQPITTADLQHYRFMEELLIVSFPTDEYRQLEELREYTDRTGNFYNNIIFDDELPIGFITYWEFERFYYIEHFATNPALRNGGYGTRILAYVCNHLQRPIVLEVERPDTEMSCRRINFYKRAGFVLWRNNYNQPPYKPGGQSIPMYLMVYGDLIPAKDYKLIKQQLYSSVYGVKA